MPAYRAMSVAICNLGTRCYYLHKKINSPNSSQIFLANLRRNFELEQSTRSSQLPLTGP